jgi:hypothetical protein
MPSAPDFMVVAYTTHTIKEDVHDLNCIYNQTVN